MIRSFILAGALSLLLLGCGSDPHEAVARESLDIFTNLTDLLVSVQHHSDMKAALPKLKVQAERLKAVTKKMKGMQKAKKPLDRDLAIKLTYQTKRFDAELKRLSEYTEVLMMLKVAMGK